MTWAKAIGQNRIKKILAKAIIEHRTAHAYCFAGDEGTGKEAVAIEFAKTLNCLSPIITQETIDYCGKCESCKMFNSLSHPNLIFIYSTPAPKTSSDSELTDKAINEINLQMRAKSQNYYHPIALSGGNQIRIGTIRELKRKLSLSMNSHGYRFVIVSRAEEMTDEAANAFLKTLEEPNKQVIIIICTAKKELILPTVLSRCQLIHFTGIAPSILKEHLINFYGLIETHANLAVEFSNGSLTRALDFFDEKVQKLRTDCVELLRFALTKINYKTNLAQAIDEIVKDKDKRKVEHFLNLTILWLRDSLAYKITGSANQLLNSDQTETIINFTNKFGDKDLVTAITIVEQSLLKIKRNVPLNLILLSMYIELRSLFYSND